MSMYALKKRPFSAYPVSLALRSLGIWRWTMDLLRMRKIQIVEISLIAFFSTQIAWCYSVVQLSTAAPLGLEAQFIAATTTQFTATVTSNPFFAGTYQISLLGLNPTYNPLITNAQLLEQINLDTQYIATVDSYTYVYGYAQGMTDQQTTEEGFVGSLGNLCGSPTNYALIQTTTGTFSQATCQDVVATIENQLFDLSLSTPPGNF